MREYELPQHPVCSLPDRVERFGVRSELKRAVVLPGQVSARELSCVPWLSLCQAEELLAKERRDGEGRRRVGLVQLEDILGCSEGAGEVRGVDGCDIEVKGVSCRLWASRWMEVGSGELISG